MCGASRRSLLDDGIFILLLENNNTKTILPGGRYNSCKHYKRIADQERWICKYGGDGGRCRYRYP